MRSQSFSRLPKIVAALGVALALTVPAAALAQQSQQYGSQPTYAQPQQPPPPPYGHQETVKGTVSGFDGQWIVYMKDDRGYTDHVTLHQGTIINPTGIKLLQGMKITIYGYANGSTFEANRVDVAYSPYSPYYGGNGEPAYGYGDSGYGYGDNGYGYGGGYGSGGYGDGGYGYGAYGGWPYLSLGVNWGWGWGGWGWPGWGWGYPYPYYGYGYGCCGGYGGYYPYYPGPGPGPRFPGGSGRIHGNFPGGGGGTIHGPISGGAPHGPISGGAGGGRAPVSGSIHGGGRPPRP
jgi:hypothetical protein